MSIIIKMHTEDRVRNLLTFDLSLHQERDRSGFPCAPVRGGIFNLSFESDRDTFFFDKMTRGSMIHNVKIVIAPVSGMGPSRVIDLYDVYCVHCHDTFRDTGSLPAVTTIQLSPGITREGRVKFERPWKVSDPFSAKVKPTTVMQDTAPTITKIDWIHPDTQEIIQETGYGEQVALAAQIINHEENTATITIEKEDGTEFENGQKQLFFEETVSADGTVELTALEIKQQWEAFKTAEVDQLIAKVTHSGQRKRSSALKIAPPLKKFMVHFRRPDDYQGKYGFDWLRDEYIHPIVTVTNDNNGKAINAPTALCKNVTALKKEYKTKDVVNPISPYGKDYYPAWLSVFPHTTTEQFSHGSSMHKNGVSLDLEIEELEPLIKDGTEILFESDNEHLIVSPKKLNLRDLTGKKKTKSLGRTTTRDYYLSSKKVNIKCKGCYLPNHEEIRVYAKLGNKKEEVGKLMVYKNGVIPKAEIVAVNVITGSTSGSLRNDYQYLFKNQSFNQALIRAEVKVDTKFDINSLPATDADVIAFKANYINTSSAISTSNSTSFKEDLIDLYEKFGKHSPAGSGIDTNANKRTYLFYTTIKAETVSSTHIKTIKGSCSANKNFDSSGVLTNIDWGNAYVIYKTALKDRGTVLHEGAHSFSLTHTFQESSARSQLKSPFIFYRGFTNNIMDYVNQVGVNTRNPFEANDQMNCFFKWQWDIMRKDRSLIFNY